MIRALVLLLLLLPGIAGAVQPNERLKDPKLEARARAISETLRCLVCQNESIDESNADLAHDLRVLVRQRLLAGDTNEQVRQYIVDRYGDFVLLKPPLMGSTLVLWFGPAVILLLGGIGMVAYLRRHPRVAATPAPLSEAERRRLAELLKEPEA